MRKANSVYNASRVGHYGAIQMLYYYYYYYYKQRTELRATILLEAN